MASSWSIDIMVVGSSQSKESDDRLEEKIDLLIQKLEPEKGKQLIQELDKKYPRK